MLVRVALLSFLAVYSLPLRAQNAQLDASKSLFTVMAAINAAGYDDGLESPAGHPIRKEIRAVLASKKMLSVLDVKDFMRQHRPLRNNPPPNETEEAKKKRTKELADAELRMYISYAMLVTDPPEFAWKAREYQLPPDVASLREFGPILARFYKEANIEDLWRRSQPAYEQAMAIYQPSAIRAVQEASGYLRAPLGGTYMGRTFKVVIDLLAAPNQIHFRPFLDEYCVVMTNSTDPHFNDIRQAYLHYLIDPVVTKFAEQVDQKKALGDYAQGAPHLPEQFKADFLLLFTRSMIRAIEARLAPPSKREAMVTQAMGEGYIMTAFFAEELVKYEKQETAMRMYFPDIVKNVDFVKEERRLEGLQFAANRVQRRMVTAAGTVEQTPVEKTLERAEDSYQKGDIEGARAAFTQALSESMLNPVQAKAYYGLGRIAIRKKDPETAVQLFEKSLQLEPPAFEKAWVLVYLGRLSAAANELPQAAQRFQAALAVRGASEKALDAAKQGLAQVNSKISQ